MFEEEEMDDVDVLECMLEIHILKEKSKSFSDDELISFIVDYQVGLETSEKTDTAVENFFNKGKLTLQERSDLENCYVLMRNNLCVDPSGKIYNTMVVLK